MHLKIDIPQKDTRLAYLCGVLAGDGYIKIRRLKNEYHLFCAGNPADEQQYYQNVIAPQLNAIFSIMISPKMLCTGRLYGISIYSKQIVEYLLSIGLQESPKMDIRVPDWIKSDDLLFASYLRGFADTDFSYKFRKEIYPIISGCSRSSNIIHEIGSFLLKKGFKPTLCQYHVPDLRNEKGYTTINRIDLNGTKNFTLWMSLVATSHPKNIIKINRYKEKVAGDGFEPPIFTLQS